MTQAEIKQLIQKQRTFFHSDATLDVEYRIHALQKLKACILKYENEINIAIRADLGKCAFESYMCETGLVLSELTYMLKHTRKFSKECTVRTPLAQFHSRSYQKPSPYGVTLIMSPWNYPFMLTIEPLIDALAAAEPGRLFRTVQLSDSGIVPGSGVGNSRHEFSRRTLGVPVVAVGVPTVVDAFSLFRQAELELDVPQGVMVTLQDVDARVREMGRLIGYGCNLALHRSLSLGEIPAFLS